MVNPIFKFKQFEVNQSGCAMKINTDGVLLAAMAANDQPKYILDIGTGTGVIALILAQRYQNAKIHAIEIDSAASATAENNFKNSVFSNRLSINNIAIEQYISPKQFDLIISNPPFFVNDLKNIEQRKGLARHTNEVFFDELIAKVASLLVDTGCFWFVLPIKQAILLIQKANGYGLTVSKQIHLHSDQFKPAFRLIVCLDRSKDAPVDEHFYIYEAEKVYTKTYKDLLKDFFLKLKD